MVTVRRVKFWSNEVLGGVPQDCGLAVDVYYRQPGLLGERVCPEGMSVPGVRGSDAAHERCVRQGREAVAKADLPGVCCWVVDLRETGGGSMWPMQDVPVDDPERQPA